MQVNVTDEMIARYLSGKATPEEESAVLDYMSENDDHLEDLLAMSAAIETNSIEAEKSKGKNVEETRNRKVRPLWPALSIAASIALIICITLPLWRTEQLQPSVVASEHTLHTEEAPLYATCDTINDNE